MNFSNISEPVSECWFVPIDILRIIASSITIVFFVKYLIVICVDKTCHTAAMILFCNSCIPAMINGCNSIGMSKFSLKNDLKQSDKEDFFCVLRSYVFYVVATAGNFSYTIQALYRYVVTVYPTNRYWQRRQCQLLVILSTWLFALIHPLPSLLTNQIVYNVDNQICQIPMKLSISLVFSIAFGFVIPVSLLMFIYVKLVAYVQAIKERVLPNNSIGSAQRHLRMVKRIVIIIHILLFLGIPYTSFILMSFFTSPPKYHFRIARTFIDIGLAFTAMISFQITNLLKQSLRKRLKLPFNQTRPLAIT